MNAARSTGKSHLLWFFDKNTKQYFLVDTGLEISVFPAARAPGLELIAYIKLTLPYELWTISTINTYGSNQLTVNLWLPRPLTWQFIKADVLQPIICADFLFRFMLLVDLDQKRIFDTRHGARIPAEVSIKSLPQVNQLYRPLTSSDQFTRLLTDFLSLTIPCTPPVIPPLDTVLLTILLPKVAQSSLRFVQLSPETLTAAASELKKLLDMGIIWPSSSTWALPIHMVIKENGEWCPCGDYRWPDDTTIPDWNPLLHIQNFESCLAGKNIYSKIDLLRAYHQIPVNKDDIAKTAIITPFGLF